MTLAAALALLLSGLYAWFLARTDFGMWLRQELTWLTVVVGVGLTLGCIALVDMSAAGLAALFFGVTGTPIIAESVLRMYRNYRAIQRRQMGGGDGD